MKLLLVLLALASFAFAEDLILDDLIVDTVTIRESITDVWGAWTLTAGGDLALTQGITSLTYNFADATAVAGTADAITLDFTPDIVTPGAGMVIYFVAEALNTGATTIAIDGGSAVNIYDSADVGACSGGEIVDTMCVQIMYDGT